MGSVLRQADSSGESADARHGSRRASVRVGSSLRRVLDWLFGFDFFISYGHDDGKNYPTKLLHALESSGYRVFLDERVYTPGTDLRRATDRRLRMSQVVVVLGRPAALASDWVQLEIQRALQLEREAVVIDINDSLAASRAETARLLADRIHIREHLTTLDADPSPAAIDGLSRSFNGVRQEVRRIRALVAALLAFIVIAAVAIGAAMVAFIQRGEARRQTTLAEAREFAARSETQLLNDPQRSLSLAVTAFQRSPIQESRLALLNATEGARLRYALRGHTDTINAARFDHAGKVIATASDDGTARLWNLATGDVRVLANHDKRVVDVQFSPDDRRIVTAGWDNRAVLWDADSGNAVATLRHDNAVTSVAFSPDGHTLATVGGRSVHVWDARTGSLRFALNGHRNNAGPVVFSPDGRWIATGGWENRARVWSARDGTLIATIQMPPYEPTSNSVQSVQFSPDGQWLLTGSSGDRTPRAWATRTWKLVKEIPDGGQTAVVSPQLPLAVLVDRNRKTSQLWQTERWSHIGTLDGEVTDAVFAPRGHRLATVSGQRTARVWSVPTGALEGGARPLLELRQPDEGMSFAAFSPDANLLVTAGVHTAYVWDITQGTEIASVRAAARVNAITASADGRHVAATTDEGVVVWNARTWQEVYRHSDPHGYWRAGVAFSPDGRYLVAGGAPELRIWESTPWRIVRAVPRPEAHGVIRNPEFNPDGSLVVAPAVGEPVTIYRTGDWRPTDLLPAGLYSFEVAAFGPNNRVLFVAGAQTASVWEHGPGGWSQTRDLRLVSGGALSAQFSPQGDRLLTSGLSSVQVWDTSSWQTLRELRGHSATVWTARFSPDGRWVATASADSTVGVWEADSGNFMGSIATSDAPLTSVTFAANGRSIITGSDDGMVRAHACVPCEPDHELLERARRSFGRVIESQTPANTR